MANTAARQAAIDNGQTLNADAAIYWQALRVAVHALTGVWVVATEGTRTYARQLYLWQNRNRPGFNPAWHPDSPYAYHLSGRAVDVGSGVGFILTLVSKAFYSIAGQYGFRATVPGEPWHFEWRLEWVAAHIRARVSGASTDKPTPIPTESEEDDDNMFHTLIFGKQTAGTAPYLLDHRDGKRRRLGQNEVEVLRLRPAQGSEKVPEMTLDQAVFDGYPKKDGSK
jgi:hypothetical protein